MTPFDPNAGAVIVHVLAPGRDLWVTVRADAAGVVTAGQPVKFPKAYPKNAPVPTTCRKLPSGSSSLLTCDAAVAAALDAVPAGTSIVSMDFAFGGTCPPWAWCAYAPNPNAGRVIVHVASPGPDLWVSVVADAAGEVRALSTPFPAGYSTASPAP